MTQSSIQSGIVARAITAAAATYPVAYVLGEGGRDAHATQPDLVGRCDCSGFFAWCASYDRLTPRMAAPAWGSPLLASDEPGQALSLHVSGLQAGARLVAGEYFRLRGRTYELTAPVRVTPAGQAILRQSPRLREATPAGERLEPLGWIETSGVYQDATSTQRLFQRVHRAEPGDGIVWPDRGGHEGHIGVIVAVDAAGEPTEVVHCSSGNYRRTGRAIARTSADIFKSAGAIYVRVKPAV